MRLLSHNDIHAIAEYLIHTDTSLEIGMSELGFDPDEYDEMEKWLWEEYEMFRNPDTCVWSIK